MSEQLCEVCGAPVEWDAEANIDGADVPVVTQCECGAEYALGERVK